MSSKAQIISSFSLYGYTLRSDALKLLQERFASLDSSDQKRELTRVVEHLNSQNLSSTLIVKDNVECALTDLSSSSAEEDVLFKVFDAFSLIRFTYNSDAKKFLSWSSLHKDPALVHGSPNSNANIFIEKYKMVHQRTARHRLFLSPAIATQSRESTYSLQSVEYLLGCSSKETVILLGMLTQLKEGLFFLEDPTGVVRLNLSKASYKGGLFTENSIILVEGVYEDKVLYVTAIGFPPPEAADVTLSYFPNFCATPYSSMNSHRLSPQLKEVEKANGESMFVFLSDVWLDQLKVMQRLQILFAGYSVVPPTCFVLIGNFFSLPIIAAQSKECEECFSRLGSLISEFPTLVKNSRFIFVPGPDDPGLPHILPRPSIPSTFLGDFLKKVPEAVFTSNPCRIQYCSQDIVVFREDVISKMCRNSIYTPWETEVTVDIPNLFVKTVVSNGHLLPLPLNVAPIYWEYDHVFWLYPLPDVVVCADKYDPYTVTSTDCIFLNPGSLLRSNYSFKVYFPSSKQVEDSEISDEGDY